MVRHPALLMPGAVLALAAPAAPALADTVNGVTPAADRTAAVATGATTTAAISITAPADATDAAIWLSSAMSGTASTGPSSVGVPVTPLTGPIPRTQTAPRGLGDSATLDLGRVRLDGPGSLSEEPVATPAIAVVGCVRNGSYYGDSRLFHLHLAPGQTTTLLVDVGMRPGLAGITPALTIAPTAWSTSSDAASTPTTGTLTVAVPRASGGRDEVGLASVRTRKGQYRLSGSVTPARAGTKVELLASAKRYAFDDIASALAPLGTRRPLATATTDASGRWTAKVQLRRAVTAVARTTTGSASTVPGASCALLLRP